MDTASGPSEGFDRSAAVTRSLLGYGVLAGAVYLGAGLVLALTREGFELARHPLSLLMLGDGGWMQRANLVVAGAMVLVAAIGVARALGGSRHAAYAGGLLGLYGAALLASAAFAPDAMAGFPPGAAGGEASLSGILHLASGAVGFVSLAAGALVVASWCAQRGARAWAAFTRASSAIIVLGFLGGAALSTQTLGVVALWVAVVAGWAWLAATSVHLYRTVPHPDADRRAPAA
ncbi:DUF998 domain-containing protein [Egibacter rhizosphaerae]|uniref:DUF998 domain-containing protein n=1 Tax=Egibacter rhizosphaerae TaxID=1670831 RepID=A0A411YF77_9ACTN|nr:DUF998 domain-containing protein [Egibacter rhizosphaerae]QBI19885.1 DUF998 domain-containing protein [Egibacter rhizosphaerae]